MAISLPISLYHHPNLYYGHCIIDAQNSLTQNLPTHLKSDEHLQLSY